MDYPQLVDGDAYNPYITGNDNYQIHPHQLNTSISWNVTYGF